MLRHACRAAATARAGLLAPRCLLRTASKAHFHSLATAPSAAAAMAPAAALAQWSHPATVAAHGALFSRSLGHRADDKTMTKIFDHPMNLNMKWNEVHKLVDHLGGKVTGAGHGATKLELNGCHASFHEHGATVSSKDDIVKIRHFLERAGVAPEGVNIPGTALHSEAWVERSAHGPGMELEKEGEGEGGDGQKKA